MASFAMGPWLAAESHQQNGAHYSWTVRTQSRFFMDASIIYPEGDEAIETLHATARLIAAAPDLYENLARMVEHFETWASDHSMEATAETWSALHCARAALAKVSPQAVSENGNVQGVK